MFGYKRVYVKASPGEVFGSLLTMFIIGAIIFVLALYISWYILIVFLGIGAIIGLVYAIYVYIRAFANSVRLASSYVLKHSGVLIKFIEKIWFVSVEAAKTAFSDNLGVASNAITRSRAHRIISFRKWMWLVAAISVIIFGLCLIAAVILVQLSLVLLCFLIIIAIVLCICAVYMVVALFYMLYESVKILISQSRKNLKFSSLAFRISANFKLFGQSFIQYFASIGKTISGLWRESVFLSRLNISSASTLRVFSLSKWLFLISPVALFLWAAIITIIFSIVLALIYLITFIPLLVWTTIMQIVH